MNNNTLIVNSIKKVLSEQRELLASLESQAEVIDAQIETHKIVIDGLEKSLEQYPTVNSDENNKTGNSADQTSVNYLQGNILPTLCKEYTLQILENSKIPLHGNEIAAKYEKTGVTNSNISTYGKAVRKHLEELEKEGLVYKTNPDALRSIRYAPVRSKEE